MIMMMCCHWWYAIDEENDCGCGMLGFGGLLLQFRMEGFDKLRHIQQAASVLSGDPSQTPQVQFVKTLQQVCARCVALSVSPTPFALLACRVSAGEASVALGGQTVVILSVVVPPGEGDETPRGGGYPQRQGQECESRQCSSARRGNG